MNSLVCFCLRNLSSKTKHFTNKDAALRYNAVGVQMLSENLHKQIFKECYTKNYLSDLNKEELDECINHLKKFDLWEEKVNPIKDVELKLPTLKGKNINEHFVNVAKDQTKQYAESLYKLISCKFPTMPEKSQWQKKPGWSKYIPKSHGVFDVQSVDFPDGSAFVFDCEVLTKHSDLPIIAVAVSSEAWFLWTSEYVINNSTDFTDNLKYLVPMESTCKSDSRKLVIGHNIGYDRARIKEQYLLQSTSTRFLDTMSMHIAISGFSSQQRVSSKSSENDNNITMQSSWVQAGSLNSLAAVSEHYCGIKLDKTMREVFVTGSLDDVVKDFNSLVYYCAKDVEATFNVLKKITPLFFSRFPHLVTFAGMLELGQMYLPINNNWNRYVSSCQHEYDNLNLELKRTLIDLMNDACHLLYNEKYKNDKWLWNLNWDVKHKKMNKNPHKDYVFKQSKPIDFQSIYYKSNNLTIAEKIFLGKDISKKSNNLFLIEKIMETANRLPLVKSHFSGAPEWYKELQIKESDSLWDLDSCKISTLTRTTPKLLRMTWLDHPLHYCDNKGWGYLVSSNQKLLHQTEFYTPDEQHAFNEIEENHSAYSNSCSLHTPAENVENLPDGFVFHRLPHKNGLSNNVGSPLSHDFIHHIESGRLSSIDYSNARRCLEINKLCSYWRSTQNRILTQMQIYLDEKYLPEAIIKHKNYSNDFKFGAIVPQVTVCGAISRRAVERTWLTASNIESDRIGSELKCMIQAPPGYCFVSADVDSQELWIGSLFGDAAFHSEHGCTALSWMTLQGNKKDKTDLHSKTAEAIGMTRSQAKIFNYARMYGAGKQAALRTYLQHNPNESKENGVERINKLYKMTKGDLLYKLSCNALWVLNKTNVNVDPNVKASGYATYEDIIKIEKAAQNAFGLSSPIAAKDLIAKKKWIGGIESEMFNKLEEIAMSSEPQTPVLKCKISTALEPSKVGSQFLPSRMNWVVQSSAVDYLHLIVVAMRWLIQKYELDAKFVFSIHDEVHYLVSEKDQYLVALALQISNLLTRSMFAYQLGMHDLPLSVAFFSSVEIDKVIRKEACDDCVTPSNPNGLTTKYGIPLGKAIDIYELLEITNGTFQKDAS